jgi:hypothetical protein
MDRRTKNYDLDIFFVKIFVVFTAANGITMDRRAVIADLISNHSVSERIQLDIPSLFRV